jgi:hypothetical protein
MAMPLWKVSDLVIDQFVSLDSNSFNPEKKKAALSSGFVRMNCCRKLFATAQSQQSESAHHC